MQKIKKFIPAALIFTPGLVFAVSDFNELATTVSGILSTIVGLLIAFAVVMFLYGVVKYITAGAEEEKKKEARNVIIYGIIGIFAMVSVWGLVGILKNTFDLEDTPISVPEIPRF